MTVFSETPQSRRMERLMTAVPDFKPRGNGVRFEEPQIRLTDISAERPVLPAYTMHQIRCPPFRKRFKEYMKSEETHMIPVLYPPNAIDFSTFGLGVLTDTVSCEATEKRNGVFECPLKCPVSGQHYGLITKECIVKAKPNDTAADQAFRIYRMKKRFCSVLWKTPDHFSSSARYIFILQSMTQASIPFSQALRALSACP